MAPIHVQSNEYNEYIIGCFSGINKELVNGHFIGYVFRSFAWIRWSILSSSFFLPVFLQFRDLSSYHSIQCKIRMTWESCVELPWAWTLDLTRMAGELLTSPYRWRRKPMATVLSTPVHFWEGTTYHHHLSTNGDNRAVLRDILWDSCIYQHQLHII